MSGKAGEEWQRVEVATEPLRKGWEETRASWSVALVPIVQNFYAELLMHRDYEAPDWAEAARLLDAALKEAEAASIPYSAIDALSLRGRLALMQEDVDAAMKYSTQAVDSLRQFGTLPALREEEVLFNHYRALKAAGRLIDAREYLDQAHTILQQKAASIKNEDHRRTFMDGGPISRDIREAWRSEGHDS